MAGVIALALYGMGAAYAEASPAVLTADGQAASPGVLQVFFSSYWPWLSAVMDAGLVVAVVVLWRMRRKNRLLQRALAQTSEAMYIQDASQRFVEVNDTACRMLGYSREELLTMGPTDIDPDVAQESIERAFQTEALGKPHIFESRHRASDGRIFPVELSGTLFEEGGVRYVVTMVRDISERKQALQRLELLERAIDQSGDAVFLVDDEASFRYVNETACRSLGYSREELLAMTPSDINPDMTLEMVRNMMRTGTGAMRIFETRHRNREGGIFPVEVSGASFERDGRKFSLVTVRDITGRKRMEEELVASERKFRSLAENLPDNVARWDTEGHYLYINPVHERTLGASASDIVGTLIPPTHPHVKAGIAQVAASGEAKVLVRQTVMVDGKLQMHEVRLAPEFDAEGRIVSVLGLGRDMTEIYRMQEAIAAREREFRSLAENIPDNVARWDAEGRFLFSNPVHQRTLGTTLDEMLGKTHAEIFPDGRFASFDETLAQVVASGEEARILRVPVLASDGGMDIHDVRLTPEFDDSGKVVSVLGLGRNMTDIYRMQETIAEREQAFRSLAESSPDYIIRYDREGRTRYLNTALVSLLGLGCAEEVIGKRPSETWPDGRFDPVEQAAARAIETADMQIIELIAAREGGGFGYNQIFVVPERGVNGDIVGTIAFGRDITDIRESERRLSHFIDNLPGLAYTFRQSADGHLGFPYVSSAIRQIYGLEPEDAMDDFRAIHNLAHPDDQPIIEAAIAESAQTMRPFRVESRVCRTGQPERWLDVRSVPERQFDGGILWYGLMLDITERKQAELELAESRGQLRGLIVQRESAREEERKHIAREIHDELGQILTGLKMSISLIGQDAVQSAVPAREHIEETMALTETAIGVVRNLTSAIRPVELDRGIVAALKWQAQRFGTFTGIPCEVCIEDDEIALDEADSVAVFRIVQESLTNVAKHARASRASIGLAREKENWHLEISDNGCGFDTGMNKPGAFGLVGMRERVLVLEGALSIESNPAAGTSIAVRWPLRKGENCD